MQIRFTFLLNSHEKTLLIKIILCYVSVDTFLFIYCFILHMKKSNIIKKLSVFLVATVTTLSGCSLFGLGGSGSPEQIVINMIKTHIDDSSYSFELKEATIDFKSPEGSGELTFMGTGNMDKYGKDSKMDISIKGDVDMLEGSGNIELQIGIISVDNKFFLNLKQVTLPAEAAMFTSALEQYYGTWFEMPTDMVPVDDEMLEGTQSQENRDKLKALLDKFMFIKATNQGSEGGLTVIDAEIDMIMLMKYLREAVSVMTGEALDESDMDLSEEEMKEITDGFSNKASFGINESDNHAYWSKGSLEGDQDGASFSITWSLNLADFNANQSITAPTQYESFQKIMEAVMMGMMGDAMESGGMPGMEPGMMEPGMMPPGMEPIN